MITIHESAVDRLVEAVRHAARTGQLSQLIRKLAYLDEYGNQGVRHGEFDRSRCTLFADSAPLSFNVSMEYLDDAKTQEAREPVYKHGWTGGLLYHGAHDNGGDGGAPTFAVNLNATTGWSLHT